MKFFLFLNKVNSNFKKADIVRYKEYSIKKNLLLSSNVSRKEQINDTFKYFR